MISHKKRFFCPEFGKEVTIVVREETVHCGNGNHKTFKTPACSDEALCGKNGLCTHLGFKS